MPLSLTFKEGDAVISGNLTRMHCIAAVRTLPGLSAETSYHSVGSSWRVLVMTTNVWGIVKEGRIVPSSPLPEGRTSRFGWPTLRSKFRRNCAEFEAWDRAGANALELVERLAREGEADETR